MAGCGLLASWVLVRGSSQHAARCYTGRRAARSDRAPAGRGASGITPLFPSHNVRHLQGFVSLIRCIVLYGGG
jgi:hypothetical protein